MDYLPIFANIKHKQCLIVGGGEIASRKARLLLSAGAHVTVVAPHINSILMAQARVTPLIARFDARHLEGITLVIAATNDRLVNQWVSELAQERHIPVNVVDDPELCSFIMPAILDRSPLMVAFSSGGVSPILTRILRGKLEALIPQNYSRLAAFADRFRALVKQNIPLPAKRRILWENALEGVIAEKVLSGDERGADILMHQMLAAEDNILRGEVYLVGAGPGDPDLLTFRALRLMQKADVVVYDNLVAKPILDMTRRDAERIYVGKMRADHTMRQEEINALLVRLAKSGKRVLRLKGGDPFIFGRGGEEIDSLADEGIPFQVVPGITAASGVAAYTGIPLTHRDHAQSCIFVTGHLKNDTMNLDWDTLARPNQTVVVYMGLHGLDKLCSKLIEHGMPDNTPIAIVQQGTTPNQRVVVGTLLTLPSIAQVAGLIAPTLIIIGGVVTLREKLSWFHPQ
jgi:uroporphyrin-III C-methyltransferase/precorrin-2 dehydrogenase/sirohydrochlorin ferrochelatase